jgi:hypothetical protein
MGGAFFRFALGVGLTTQDEFVVAAGFGAEAVGGGEQAGECGRIGQTESAADGQSAEVGVGEGELQAVPAIEVRVDFGERRVGELDGLGRRRRSGCGRSD